ncbi:VirB3 family type IV secretion system protein [Megamonas hypermegale]|uniref:VirB3 family type IV secretion system protein n=1 Tax=Megamonas hypermegale TaxID=158847 RepID=UPI003C6CC5A1
MDSKVKNVFPLYKSLTQQILLCGAPRKIIIFNIAFAALCFLTFKVYYLLIVNIAIHFISAYITKFDDQFFDCLHRYLSKKKFYGV